MKKIFLFLILVLSIFILVTLYFDILYPSYLSVSNACGTISEEELNNSGYFIAGEYDSCNDSITIFYNVTEENRQEIVAVNKHESCHRFQAKHNHLYSCNQKLFLFINEMFCYSSEYLPDKVYNKIYLNRDYS